MNATLVIGGTRSGKSRYAEQLLGGEVPVRYLATGRRTDGDAEWDARIAAHVVRRPAAWTTEEVSGGALVAALAVPGPVLVDDLGTWLAGVLDDAGAWDRPGPHTEIDELLDGLVAAVAGAPGPVVLVSAEVGLGVVPGSASGRLFRDLLGGLNAALAEVCAETVLVVAGRALRLPGPDSGTAGAPAPAAGVPAPAPGVPAPAADSAARAAGVAAGGAAGAA
ncbi:bifunctional adenosylcobinamide kinase/adenosylcobinamide-phosphate guanylyltransferase, partial [Pseudonocardia kongjuensis]|uniref:bifunctional adenosylcobinamide kinase/adenosylcobinamide-phosphate guanylyltransferase n=1 Tax=Pseudonocardia kongjuensis TaxID=102227 RepID=UPI0031D24ADE